MNNILIELGGNFYVVINNILIEFGYYLGTNDVVVTQMNACVLVLEEQLISQCSHPTVTDTISVLAMEKQQICDDHSNGIELLQNADKTVMECLKASDFVWPMPEPLPLEGTVGEFQRFVVNVLHSASLGTSACADVAQRRKIVQNRWCMLHRNIPMYCKLYALCASVGFRWNEGSLQIEMPCSCFYEHLLWPFVRNKYADIQLFLQEWSGLGRWTSFLCIHNLKQLQDGEEIVNAAVLQKQKDRLPFQSAKESS